MHEYGLTKGIVALALDVAAKHGAQRVLTVRVVAGDNVGLIPESVQLYFDEIARGTPAEGAEVLVRAVKPQMRCPQCGRWFVRPLFSFACPDCGAQGRPTEIGNEFYIESVELECDPPPAGKDIP